MQGSIQNSSPLDIKKDKRTIHDIKLAEMHMKRRVPQLYLSKNAKLGGQEGKMNDFNSALKKSLLSPRKHRYIATLREQALLNRAGSFSPKQSRNKTLVNQSI